MDERVVYGSWKRDRLEVVGSQEGRKSDLNEYYLLGLRESMRTPDPMWVRVAV